MKIHMTMKHKCKMRLVFIMAMLWSSHAYSQLYVKAGYTSATMNLKDSYEQKFQSAGGFVLGVGYIKPVFSPSLSVSAEVLLIEKGLKNVYESVMSQSRAVSKTTTHIRYVEIPVLARYSFQAGPFGFFVNGGFSFSAGLNGRYESILQYQPIYPNGPWNTDSSYLDTVEFGERDNNAMSDYHIYLKKRVDIGIQVGGGLKIKKRVFADFRYGLGLTNLGYDDRGNRNYAYWKVQPVSKNRVIQLSLGYLLTRN
jgi:hypothetical protein